MADKKKLSNLMLLANFLSTLFYSCSYPYVYAETIKAVSKAYISAEQIISCLGIIVCGALWNKYSDKLFGYYNQMMVLEILADIVLFGDVLLRNDLRFYFILNIIIYSVITKNICCGGIKMRAMVNPTEQLRERYDNNSNTAYAVATIIGTGVAVITDMNLRMLFVLAFIGNIIDNVIYLYIYKRLSKGVSV